MLPWSAVGCLDVCDLAGPRASGNVRRAQMLCYVIVERVCVGASSVAVGLCLAGLLPAWILGESENGCLHTLLTLFEQSKNSLHQLLMKAITKLCKKWQVCGDLWCPCVWESACVCLCGRK